MKVSDYFAELYVAGRFADAGWNVYFPHRDTGFDFIITKPTKTGHDLIRPVQVKGKYPTEGKGDKPTYGYVGELSRMHPDMVLAIPFFSKQTESIPSYVAYMPISLIRTHSRGFRCEPASFKDGSITPRRDYAKFFDEEGLELLDEVEWRNTKVVSITA
jgi:hypothetical protein